MRFVDDDDRLLAVCAECGAVYVSVKRQDGEIRPIGSKPECQACGGDAFEPISGLEDRAEASDDDD